MARMIKMFPEEKKILMTEREIQKKEGGKICLSK